MANLQALPEATVETRDAKQAMRARAATGEERERLWDRWRTYSQPGQLDGWASRRPSETAVVILEPVQKAS